MGKLTTHILDTSNGVPADSVALRLYRLDNSEELHHRKLLVETSTNMDGRCDKPLLSEVDMMAATYELEFEAGSYFSKLAGMEEEQDGPRFLDCVVIRFGINDPDSHYHVPLLISPFGYSTYRGS